MQQKCLVFAAALGLLVVPLAPAQEIADSPGIAVDANGARLIHRAGIRYPSEALDRAISGTVVVELKLDADANVADAAVVSGPGELRKSVLQSVLAWHFAKDSANGTRRVTITFQPPAASPAAPSSVRPVTGAAAPDGLLLRNIRIEDLSDESRDDLLAHLPAHSGDVLSADLKARLAASVNEFDSHLAMTVTPISPTEAVIAIGIPHAAPSAPLAPGRLRVGGEVQQRNLISQARPVYPPEAKFAKLQGTVRLEATIAKDGHVAELQLISGPPELVDSALTAVRQWVYRPTLLNGNPVEVVTTVDINYTLAK